MPEKMEPFKIFIVEDDDFVYCINWSLEIEYNIEYTQILIEISDNNTHWEDLVCFAIEGDLFKELSDFFNTEDKDINECQAFVRELSKSRTWLDDGPYTTEFTHIYGQ